MRFLTPYLPILGYVYAQAGEELLDYFIQDVCRDSGTGQIVQGDPLSCGPNTYRSNINLGEHTPYLLTDFDRSNNNVTYFSYNSIPVHATDNTLKIMIMKCGQGNFDGNYQYNFVASRDGYDLIDTTYGNYASFIRTSDGGCYDQIWSHNGGTSATDRAGGWILFPWTPPSQLPASDSADITTYHVQVTQGISGCTDGHSTGVSYWNGPASYTFETGKTITCIRQFHFAATELSSQNNALEMYYFSREYGATRWEAWVPRSRCEAENGSGNALCYPENRDSYPLEGRCSVLVTSSTGVPGLDTFGNQDWVRVDCRDSTNYVALNTPQLLLDRNVAQDDGFADIDYDKTVAGQ